MLYEVSLLNKVSIILYLKNSITVCPVGDDVHTKLVQYIDNKVCGHAVKSSTVEDKIFKETIAEKIIILQHKRFNLMQNILKCFSNNIIVMDPYDRLTVNFADVCPSHNLTSLVIDISNYKTINVRMKYCSA